MSNTPHTCEYCKQMERDRDAALVNLEYARKAMNDCILKVAALTIERDHAEQMERDRARLLASLKEAATLLSWCGGTKNMRSAREFDRLIAEVEGEK